MSSTDIHFIGIGGAGMSSIAHLFVAAGHQVSGSDRAVSAATEALEAEGVTVHIGHDAANVPEGATVVYSTAIREDNPELTVARQRGLRLWHRSEALREAMVGKNVVAVAGTHGKTTTSAMCAVALQAGGAAPSFAIGAVVPELGASSGTGEGDVFVAEADESDGSFLNYSPSIIVLTNVEADHLDHYGSEAAVVEAFRNFIRLLPPEGLLVACADDAGALKLAGEHRNNGGTVLLYGANSDADVVIEHSEAACTGGGEAWSIRDHTGEQWELRLAVPGFHNVLNAAAALTVARYVGADLPAALGAFSTFTGAKRRFEHKFSEHGITLFDDYAHHPTEVRAALTAARTLATARDGRVLALFQPHLYSRTAAFADEFGEALELADLAWVLPIFAAREDPIPGITAGLITVERSAVRGASSAAEAVAALVAEARPGDILLTLGAGDITALDQPISDSLDLMWRVESAHEGNVTTHRGGELDE